MPTNGQATMCKMVGFTRNTFIGLPAVALHIVLGTVTMSGYDWFARDRHVALLTDRLTGLP